MTKRARLATLALRSVNNLCLLQQINKKKIEVGLRRLIINAPCKSLFMAGLDFSSVAYFSGRCREVILTVGDTLLWSLPFEGGGCF